MIIMTCGKGGCGKSTVTSLLAAEYVRRGKKVVVIDMDESNFGLHRTLGLKLPEDFTLYFGYKKGVFEKLDHLKEGEKLFEERWTYDTLPAEFVSEGEGVKLMAVGKIHEAGEGCACPMGALAKQLLLNMEQKEDEVVLVDAEAGVEHFGRGVDEVADRILMIADPSFESVALTEKIGNMSEKIGKKMGIILNKVTPEQEQIMREGISRKEQIIGAVYVNADVMKRGLLGQQMDLALPEIGKIAEMM